MPDDKNKELLIGKNPVISALEAHRPVNKILLSEHMNDHMRHKITHLGKACGAVIQDVPKKRLDQLADGTHQGVAAYVAPYAYSAVDDLFTRADQSGEPPFFIILDELEDPHNLGSILRTADAAGAHGVIIGKHRSAGLTSAVAKTAAGALEHVPVARVTNIAKTIDHLKNRHVWVVGTDADADEDYRYLEGDLSIGLVVGNEGKGISQLVKKKCDWMVGLPMQGHVSSLNVSVASALLMYEIRRKRPPAGV